MNRIDTLPHEAYEDIPEHDSFNDNCAVCKDDVIESITGCRFNLPDECSFEAHVDCWT